MQPTSPATEGRPRADWARAAEGIQLAGISVFLLLNTTGVLPWSFWLDALSLWPVLIMSAGIRIAFEKTRAPWLLLAGPALVLGSLAWVASGARPDVPVGPWTRETQARPAGATRLQFKAHLAGSRLQLQAAPIDKGLLAEVRTVARPPNGRVDTRGDGSEAILEVKGGWHRNSALPPWRKQRWQVTIPPTLPVRLQLDGAGARVIAELSQSSVRGGRIEGVFIGTELKLPPTPQPVTLELRGVFNALHLSVPEGTPLKVLGTGLPFNLLDRGVPGAAGVAGYQVKVDGIFTAVTVETHEPPAPAPSPAEELPAEAAPAPATDRPTPEATPSPAGERPRAEAAV